MVDKNILKKQGEKRYRIYILNALTAKSTNI